MINVCKGEMFQKCSKLREICICHMSSVMVMLSAAMQVSGETPVVAPFC